MATETEALKRLLQSLALDADVVLDLHCDNQAVLHVYTGTPLALISARAASRAATSRTTGRGGTSNCLISLAAGWTRI